MISKPLSLGRKALCRTALCTGLIASLPVASQAAVPMTGTGSYAQNFNTLATSGTTNTWADNSTIANWYSNRIVYLANGGTTNNGGLYSYGTGTATERALGSLGSGSANPVTYGVVLQNTSAGPLEIDSIAYTGEQWRYGGTAGTVNVLAFDYVISASAITAINPADTPNPIVALDFASPITSGTAGGLDGNATANRTVKSATTQIIVPAGNYILLRWNDPDNGGSDNGISLDDLTVTWKPSAGQDTTPPSISVLDPADDAVNVPLDVLDKLELTFSEPIALTTGNILVKKVSDNSVVNTLDVSDFGQVELNGAQLSLIMANPLEYSTAYYVEIPAGAVTDLATSPNAFAGISGPTAWNFTSTAAPTPPTVVVNKYLNGGPDRVELLVIGNGTPGTTVDMRGMILKDYSGDVVNDNGGSYTFSTDSLWSAVPVGTLISLSEVATTSDTNVSDFVLSVGLQDTTYFDTSDGGQFDIAGTEMIMIKAAGSGVDGNIGGIHALSGGALAANTFFSSFTGAKVRANLGAATNQGVRALNGTSDLADYVSGTDAEGGITLLAGDFGAPNSPANSAYIAELRGLNPGDGEGVASVVNLTPGSPFLNRGFFDNGQTGQTAKVVITTPSATTLTNVTIAVPNSLGTPAGATLGGAGAGSANISVVGQNITITGAAITTTDSLEVTITGLSTPNPTLASDNGNNILATSTSGTGGTLTPVAFQPAVRVVTPISSFRDVDVAGVALDSGAVVAVEGIVTEEDFGSGTANFSGYIQDTTGGINIFSAVNNPGLVRGHRVAVLGTVVQFNGLTEIVPAASADVIDLGTETEPAPLTIPLADLLAAPETYEGTLVKVENLTYVSGNWGTGGTTTPVLEQSGAQIQVFVATGSTATTEPAYPVTITGIFSQRDTASPFTANYQLQPRVQADLVSGGAGNDYDTWASGPTGAAGGGSADPDGDGKDNSFEYAFGLNASSGVSANPFTAPLNKTTAKFTYTRRTQSLTNLTYKVYTSSTLQTASWVEDTTATQSVVGTAGEVQTVEVTLSAAAPLTAPQLFIRVVAE